MTRRRGLLLALILAPFGLSVAVASAAERDGYVTSFDQTRITYAFFPAQNVALGAKAPTVMDGPGYSMSHAGASDATVAALTTAGYNVLTWDPRGFGNSGGNVETDSPAYEGRDAQALIDYLARQPEVQLDKPGDPRLGMIGASYGGGIQYATASIDPRVDVITPQIAWHSLVTSLDKSNTAKGGWGSLLYSLGASAAAQPNDGPAGPQTGRMQDPATTTAIQDGIATGSFTPDDQAYFASRGPGDDGVARIHVPTLISQGTDDTLFTLHEGIENLADAKRAGVPAAMIWFCGGLTDKSVAHGVCLTPQGPDPSIVLHESLLWLNRYLKGDTSVDTGPGFRWVSDVGTLHYARSYPVPTGAPAGGTGSGTLAVAAGDTSGQAIAAGVSATGLNVPLTTPPVGTQLLGEPQLTLDYDGTAASADGRVYAQLVDLRKGLVVGNQVTPVPVVLDGQEHTLTIPLEAVAADVVAGSSYELQLIGGTSVYFAARQPAAITVRRAQVTVPTVAAGASSTSAAVALDTPQSVVAGCRAGALRLTLHARPGTRIIRARLFVDGRLRSTTRGRRLTRLVVRGLAPKRHTVRVDTFTKRGLAVRSTRTVDACGTAHGVTHERTR